MVPIDPTREIPIMSHLQNCQHIPCAGDNKARQGETTYGFMAMSL